ncbi:MAG: hypothetical protein COY40_04210 [Alphaproteobacteria bacterium CG_4_10_14_0_8_um_filter_53_9]|nr:MAG: hypothetical protein COY40_04210 [Alphaproteobacteria bacterium CG_4_10_14_0_8_um_filter_53_9]
MLKFMDILGFFTWYVAPWRRFERGVFNGVFLAVTLVPMLMGISQMGSFLEPFLMLLMAPLLAGRARDIGFGVTGVRVMVGGALVGTCVGLFKLMGLPTLGLGFVAGLVSFGVLTYLCIKGSAPRIEAEGGTGVLSSAKVSDNDDYPDPFKPR